MRAIERYRYRDRDRKKIFCDCGTAAAVVQVIMPVVVVVGVGSEVSGACYCLFRSFHPDILLEVSSSSGDG